MLKKCEQCGNEFEATRETAKYCDAKCRKLAFLEKDKVSVPELSVPCRADIYSPNYDMSEEGFKRRNRNWLDFSDRFRENVKRGVLVFREERIRQNKLLHEGDNAEAERR